MRKIRVHLKSTIKSVLDRIGKTNNIGGAQTHFSRSADQMHAGIFPGYSLHYIAGIVRRIIIDYQYMELFGYGHDTIDHFLDIDRFVIGWDNDQTFIHYGIIVIDCIDVNCVQPI